jgi:transposase
MITSACDPLLGVDEAPDPVPDDVDTSKAALSAERMARREFEARASGAEAMVAHLKLVIAELRHDRFGASSERGRKLLNQLELELDELEAAAAEDEAAGDAAAKPNAPAGSNPIRRKPVRGPLPAHLPRERVVIPGPTTCPCCNGALTKLGEDITETLEVIPRQWKVIQTVRERLAYRACETVSQAPAPFHPIARGRDGPQLLAMILEAKFGQHLSLNPQSTSFAQEGIEIDVSSVSDACASLVRMLLNPYEY